MKNGRSTMMDKKVLAKLHIIECIMLKDFDDYFKENDIKYSLAGGNLIGAIRHNGFIPWDDDMDIIMSRNNYLKFLSLWKVKRIEGYSIAFECDKTYGLTHTKIFRNNTIFCAKKDLKKKRNHGIWLDLFVMDKIPLNPKARKKFLSIAKKRIALCRHKIYKKGTFLQKILSIALLFIPWFIRKRMINRYNKYIYSFKDLADNYEYIELSTPALLNCFYSKRLLDSYFEHKYENYSFMIITNYDEYLNKQFGDYMVLPPEEERVCKHSPEVLEFGDLNFK